MEGVLSAASSMVKNIAETRLRERVVQDIPSKEVHWCPPSSSWVKINTDGAASNKEDCLASGVILRGSDGGWIAGFQ